MGLQYQVKTGEPTKMYRKKGGQVDLYETSMDEYSQIANGYFRLKLTGISEPFDLESTFGKNTCVRLEIKVIAAMKPSGQSSVGKKFTDLVSFSVSPKSHFGMLISAISGGGELVDGDATDYLGGEFEAPVSQVTKPDKQGVTQTYNKVAYESVTPVGAEEEEAAAPPPAQTTRAKAAAAPARNPLTGDDEDEV